MKYIFLTLLFSSPLFAKEITEYKCGLDKELSVDLSLLDKNTPSVSFFSKKSKIATCQYENTPLSKMSDPRAIVQVSQWHLKLKKCDYYLEKHKEKMLPLELAMFKESHERREYDFLIVQGHQPLKCRPKK